ncbi:hypothetical protein PM082_024071 [Marasmius tenuissimus]|nr:hypothetical protein PM082_024071 [Marasmius tenuissimus]
MSGLPKFTFTYILRYVTYVSWHLRHDLLRLRWAFKGGFFVPTHQAPDHQLLTTACRRWRWPLFILQPPPAIFSYPLRDPESSVLSILSCSNMPLKIVKNRQKRNTHPEGTGGTGTDRLNYH